MKNIKSGLLLIFIIVNLTKCESLLDINPSDQYSKITYWQTKEHADAALTGIYRTLHPFGNQFFFEFDMLTSNALAYNEANGTDAISKGVHTPTTFLINNLWQSCYKGIGRANTFLDKIDEISMSDADKNQMKGEALFLRAYFYFQLTDKFGAVPLILETPDAVKHSALPRTSKADCVTQIIKDLTDASTDKLKDQLSNANLGRVTRGAALALKARVHLYNEQWEAAASTSKAIIDSEIYSLFPDYRHFWFFHNAHNSEVIFNIEYKSPEFLLDYEHVIYTLNRPAPLKELVDVYLMNDGKTTNRSTLYDPARPYENRDPRLHYTIACIGYPFNGKLTAATNVVTTGFGMKKYTSYEDNVNKPSVGQEQSLFNPILIRYAEVLLTYAEAENEINGPTSSVYEQLKKVRSRVNMPNVEINLTKEQMRQEIQRERRVEFAMEGLYYSDILRWKTAEIENKGPVHNSAGITITNRSFNPQRDYLWPVPYDQSLLNPKLLPNNQNW